MWNTSPREYNSMLTTEEEKMLNSCQIRADKALHHVKSDGWALIMVVMMERLRIMKSREVFLVVEYDLL